MADKKPIAHMIGNAHIDPIWLWKWQEGYAEIKATFQSALDRLDQFPDCIFTSACAVYYKWVEENEPAMFKKIVARVKENRWNVVGGWWLQPDCNIPSGESFARHALYSQRYFKSRFGKTAKVGYNVDSFGHNGNLPQLYKKSGIDAYIFMRPDSYNEKHYPFPNNTPFLWKGVDGTELLTSRIHMGYGFGLNDREFEAIERDAVASGQKHVMVFYGIGNHGGGPTVRQLDKIHEVQKEDRPLEYVISCPDEYFACVMREWKENGNLPVLAGDLQHHASGCYSTHNETKMNNRRAENRLTAAEKCLTLSNRLLAIPYDNARMEEAWQKVLFNQFHDIMGGCSIKEAYDDVRETYGFALTVAGEAYNAALQKISWNINTDKGFRYLSKQDGRIWEMENKGFPIVIYNPNSWAVHMPVQINYPFIEGGITTSDGTPVAWQKVRGPQTNGTSDMHNIIFMADVPAMGYTTYWFYRNEPHSFPTQRPRLTSEFYMENDHIRVEFDHTNGCLRSIFDKDGKTELLRGRGARGVVLDESDLDTWGHRIFRFGNDIGEFAAPEFRVIETGPVRAKVRVTTHYESCDLEQDFILYNDASQVEVDCRVFWKGAHKLLKLAFETSVQNPHAVYEIPYGQIVKDADGNEEPTQNWSAVEDGKAGLAILNNGKYSCDVKESELRMTVLRGTVYADHFGYEARKDGLGPVQEQGEQFFKYVIKPYSNGLAASGVVRRAWELNNPLVFVPETYHEGPLPQEMAGVEIDCDNVILSAMKRAEDGGATIVRLYECNGIGGAATVKLPFLKAEIKADFGPFEIRTFCVGDNGTVTETNLVEEKL